MNRESREKIKIKKAKICRFTHTCIHLYADTCMFELPVLKQSQGN